MKNPKGYLDAKKRELEMRLKADSILKEPKDIKFNIDRIFILIEDIKEVELKESVFIKDIY